MKKKPHELTFEEANNFIEKNYLNGNIVYHAISNNVDGLTKLEIAKIIIESGFEFNKVKDFHY